MKHPFIGPPSLRAAQPLPSKSRNPRDDVTELAAIEAACTASEQFFRSAFENASVGFAIHDCDPASRYLDVNDAFCRMTGYKREQLIGRSPSEITGPTDPYADVRTVHRALEANGGRATIVKCYLRSDGKPLRVRIDVSVVTRSAQGLPLRFLSVIQELTELQEMQTALAASELRSQLAVENAEIGVWDWNIQTDQVFYSERMSEIVGADSEAFRTAEDWCEHLHPDDRAGYYAALAAHHEGRAPIYRHQLRVRQANGTYKWVSDLGKVVARDDTGRPLRMVGTTIDIDRRTRAELALRESEAKFRGIFESTRRVIGLLGTDGRNLDTNPTGYAFTGLTPDATRSLFFWDGDGWLNDADRARIKDAVHRSSRGEYVQFEIQQRAHTGEVVTNDLTMSPIFDANGNVTRLLAEAHDITVLKQTQALLATSEQLFRAAFEHAPIGFALIRAHEDRYLNVNDALCQMLGYPREELVGKPVIDVTAPDDPNRETATMHAHLRAGGGRTTLKKRFVRRDGEIIHVQMNLALVGALTEPTAYSICQMQDVTERVRREAALHEAQELSQVTLASMAEGLVRTDIRGSITLCNAAAARLCGASIDDIVGRRADDVCTFLEQATRRVLPSHVQAVLATGGTVRSKDFLCLRGVDGRERFVTMSCSAMHTVDGNVLGAVMVLQDAADAFALTNTLATLASQDELTGLLNRRALKARIEASTRQSPPKRSIGYLLYIDLDRFKLVNDACGHEEGDELLRDVGRLLQTQVRLGDSLARIGGDEFALLLRDVVEETALEVARRIITSLETYSFVRHRRAFSLGASIGLTALEGADTDGSNCMARADAACAAAKAEGRGRAYVYRSDAAAIIDAQHAAGWSYLIQNGLENGHFQLFLQRIVSAAGHTCGCEVLMRLTGRNGGVVPPVMFMASAKRFGLMTKIDQQIFDAALNLIDSDGFRNGMGAGRYLSVNLGAKSIADPLFRLWLIERLDQHSSTAAKLWIEITESDEINWSADELAFLAVLRKKGVRIYLDDFGTGYNSFDVLKRLPVDGIKIDRSVTKDIVSDQIDQALVKAAVSIVADLGIDLVAEGIEDAATLEYLRQLGVRKFQGYLFHVPEPADAAIKRPSSTCRCDANEACSVAARIFE
jgi:diguanylate cyclase (GGDEF)-like protein/PAS domain S-box-containing protein